MDKIHDKVVDSWYVKFIYCGEYALWNYNEELYGILSTFYNESITLADYMEQIGKDEYCNAMEKAAVSTSAE